MMPRHVLTASGRTGVRLVVVLDTTSRDERGRTRGHVSVYDPRYRGPGPRGADGTTCDGRLMIRYFAEEFDTETPRIPLTVRGSEQWALSPDSVCAVRDWVRERFRSEMREIPHFPTLGGFRTGPYSDPVQITDPETTGPAEPNRKVFPMRKYIAALVIAFTLAVGISAGVGESDAAPRPVPVAQITKPRVPVKADPFRVYHPCDLTRDGRATTYTERLCLRVWAHDAYDVTESGGTSSTPAGPVVVTELIREARTEGGTARQVESYIREGLRNEVANYARRDR
jgi:hypothetical protein